MRKINKTLAKKITGLLLAATLIIAPGFGLHAYAEDEENFEDFLLSCENRAEIYTDASYAEPAADVTDIITVRGILPEDAVVKAYPVDVTVAEDEENVAAYDITIFDAEGNIFQPTENQPVKVSVASDRIEADKELKVYHMNDIDSEPELLGSEKVEITASPEAGENTEITFEANHFSIYVITYSEGETPGTTAEEHFQLDQYYVALSPDELVTVRANINHNTSYASGTTIEWIDTDPSIAEFGAWTRANDGTGDYVSTVKGIAVGKAEASIKVTKNTNPRTEIAKVEINVLEKSTEEVSPSGSITHDKSVVKKDDGTYDIELTFSGTSRNITKHSDVEVVFVVDASGSMNENAGRVRVQVPKSEYDRTSNNNRAQEAVSIARYNVLPAEQQAMCEPVTAHQYIEDQWDWVTETEYNNTPSQYRKTQLITEAEYAANRNKGYYVTRSRTQINKSEYDSLPDYKRTWESPLGLGWIKTYYRLNNDYYGYFANRYNDVLDHYIAYYVLQNTNMTKMQAAHAAIDAFQSAAKSDDLALNARYALVKFNATDGGTYDDADIIAGWTDSDGLDSVQGNLTAQYNTGTNYEAGFMLADELLKNDHAENSKRIVVFLTDGNPTAHYNANGSTNFGGNGSATTAGDMENAVAVLNQIHLGEGDYFYAIGCGDTDEAHMKTLSDSVPSGVNHAYVKTTSPDELISYFEDIASGTLKIDTENVTISDQLSQYVDINVSDGDSIRIEESSDFGLTWTTSPEGEWVISNENGSVGASHVGSLDSEKIYKLVIPVAANDTAVEYYKENMGYPKDSNGNTYVGGPGTGATSAGKEGFPTNESATVSWYESGSSEQQTYTYNVPVMQVNLHAIEITKSFTFIRGCTLSEDDKNDISFVIKKGDETVKTVSYADMTDGEDGQKKILVYLPDGSYKVDEIAPESTDDATLVYTTINGLNGHESNPIVLGEDHESSIEIERADFVNTYKSAQGTLKITKTVNNNINKRKGSFTFLAKHQESGITYTAIAEVDGNGTESIDIENLPIGTYTITELDNAAYEAVGNKTFTTTLAKGETKEINFVNKGTGDDYIYSSSVINEGTIDLDTFVDTFELVFQSVTNAAIGGN